MRITVIWAFAIFMAAGMIASVHGGLTFEEGLSLFFREIAVTNGDSLVLTTEGLGENHVQVRMGQTGSFHSAGTGSTVVVQRGMPFCFRHAGERAYSRLSLVETASLTNVLKQIPERYRQETQIILFEGKGELRLVSEAHGEMYSCADGVSVPFRLPFRRVWRDEREFSLWSAGLPYRHRIDEIREIVGVDKMVAEERYAIVARWGGEIKAAFEGKGLKRARIAIGNDLRRGCFAKVQNVVVQVDDTGKGRRVVGVGTEPLGGSGRACNYVFDDSGRLRWLYSVAINGDKGSVNPDAHRIVGFDADGKIRRAYCGPVPMPLFVMADRTCFFTGDSGLLRDFFSDFGNAMKYDRP